MYVCMYVCMYVLCCSTRCGSVSRNLHDPSLLCEYHDFEVDPAFQLRTASKQAFARDIQLRGLRGFDIV